MFNKRAVALILAFVIIFFTGCGKDRTEAFLDEEGAYKTPFTIRLGYSGELYEIPVIAGIEKGIFRKEGINVELVKIDRDALESGFSKGRIDASTCDYRIFKSVSNGTDIRLIAGLHGFCTRILTDNNSSINCLKDLKNKAAAVNGPGNGPMVIVSKLLNKEGLNPGKDITWNVYPREKLRDAVLNNKADVLIEEEPSEKKVDEGFRILFSSSEIGSGGHSHGSSLHLYGSFAGLSGKFIKNSPEKASYVARAWVKAAKWVSENQKETIRLAVDKKFIKGSFEYNLNQSGSIMWTPGVSHLKGDIETYIKEQKALGVLDAGTDEKNLADRIYGKVLPELGG